MSEAALDRLLILFSAGLGLMVLGGLNYLLNGLSRRVRMSLSASAAIACSLAPMAISSPQVSAFSFSAILVGLGFLTALSSTYATNLFQSAMTYARRPGVHATVLVSSGIVLMAGSLTQFSSEEELSFDQDLAWMTEICARPRLHDSSLDTAETDRGQSIALKTPDEPRNQAAIDKLEKQVQAQAGFGERSIRSQPASDVCNCHGWVFTGGRYWLSPDDVEQILKDNGYQPVSEPRAGDVVIYRQGTLITHTAIVRTSGAGEPLLVEGKWGWMGVFLHRPEDSPYGKAFEFHRSNRAGHVLHGLEPASE